MTGVRRHGAGFQAEVRVTGQPRSVKQFDEDTPPAVMQRWRKEERKRLRALTPRLDKGSFAADAADYLTARRAMPGIKERTRHIALWIREFGARPRSSIQPWEIAAVRDRWLTEGPKLAWRRWTADGEERYGGRWVELRVPLSASQVNKRLRALENLWTVLDGRHAHNPVRDVAEPEEPDSDARGLTYAVVEAILAQLPDRGRPADGARPGISLTKLRLRAIAYTGLSHGQLGALNLTTDIDAEAGAIKVPGRRKGKTQRAGWRPVPAEGIRTLIALREAGGEGRFSHSSMWKSFQRACAKLDLAGLRPYDFRHSAATEIFEKTGDLKTTQLLMGHQSDRTTLRYAQRALNPVLVAAIEKIRTVGGFSGKVD